LAKVEELNVKKKKKMMKKKKRESNIYGNRDIEYDIPTCGRFMLKKSL
jgi:hypothetical protein